MHERGILLSGSSSHQLAPRGTTTINFASVGSSLNNAHQQQQGTRAMAIDHLYQLIMQAASEQKGFQQLQIGPSDQKKKNYTVLKTYHVSGAMIDGLKRKHFPMRRGSLPFSTFEILAAHLWKVSCQFLSCSFLNPFFTLLLLNLCLFLSSFYGIDLKVCLTTHLVFFSCIMSIYKKCLSSTNIKLLYNIINV